ncbi:hypothetical protein AMTR_s00091p00043740 [Amborella trichopoda]|uniref:Uncharacterized protein n=1 Tax=Amborella trichopoda TaxID=13333 RepID=W1NYY9_AMBTC|nr:hypothetical protein AMTR_s00091p00043740 [Amborella trichopoda]
MWLQKVYCQSTYLYYWSACLYCRSHLFNHQSDVAPEGLLPEHVFVLPECVSSLSERPIQSLERYGSKGVLSERVFALSESMSSLLECLNGLSECMGRESWVKATKR